jgi:hypothetical protein
MVTFADLREAQLGAVSTAADAWDQLAGKSRALEQRVIDELAGPIRKSGRKGTAANAAFERMTALHDEFELDAVQTRNVAIILRAAATEFNRLQKNLQAAIDAAVMLGLTVGNGGTVHPPALSYGDERDPDALDAHRLAAQNATSTPTPSA